MAVCTAAPRGVGWIWDMAVPSRDRRKLQGVISYPKPISSYAQDPKACGQALTEAGLLDAADAVRRAVAAAFPGGLPEWDVVRRILEGRERHEDSHVSCSA